MNKRIPGAVFRAVPLAVTLAVFLALGGTALADISRTISFQGILNDAANHPKPDGSYPVSFRLFASLTPVSGEIPLWAEPNVSVTVSGGKGLFSAVLGAPTAFPASLSFHDPVYLEVQVAPDAPMTPRVPLYAVPYALNAGSLSLPFSGTAEVGSPALHVANTGSGGIGVQGDGDYAGVKGTAAKGRYGVLAMNADGAFGFLAGPALPSGSLGVYGTGSTMGVMGESNTGDGVYGAQNGTGYGVHGKSVNGTGVMGEADSASPAILGLNSSSGPAVYGNSEGGEGVKGNSFTVDGVLGTSSDSQHAGVFGVNTGGGFGVYGFSRGGGAAVRAENAATGTALEIKSGAIRVTGAGVGSPTAAFIHVATSANTTGQITTIDNPLCNGDPNALLIVTSNRTPGGVFTDTHDFNPFGVIYYQGHWEIFDGAGNIPLSPQGQGPAWNVLVIKP